MMALRTEDLFDKAMTLSKDADETFLELGRTLRQLQDREPKRFQEIVAKSDLGRRKAYYLVDVSRVFDPLRVSCARLKKVGWTKLGMIAKQVTQDNVDEFLDLAVRYNVKELERMIQRKEPLGDESHCVLMYFSKKEYEEVEEALKHYGARKAQRGSGLADKENALLKILRKAMGKDEGESVGHFDMQTAQIKAVYEAKQAAKGDQAPDGEPVDHSVADEPEEARKMNSIDRS